VLKNVSVLTFALLAFSVSAHAGAYRRALFSGALIWSERPRTTEEATWSGKRDAQGYATGYGTLTWYSRERMTVTGSSILRENRSAIVTRSSGYMEQGKFVNPPTDAKVASRAQRKKSRQEMPAKPEKTAGAAAASASPATARNAATATPSPSPTPAPSPSSSSTQHPRDDALDSLARPPSSLGLSATPETSPHPTPEQSASPSP